MTIVQVSQPTKAQIVHSIERVVGVFVVSFLGYMSLTNYTVSKVAVHGAILAGFTAAYQAVQSTLTNI